MFVPGSYLSGDVKELSISNFNFEEEGSYTGINAYRNSKAAVAFAAPPPHHLIGLPVS